MSRDSHPAAAKGPLRHRSRGWPGGARFGRRRCLAFAASCVFLLAVSAMAGDIYHSVFSELTRHENRLPGTEAYASSLDHLENTLRDAGLTPHRQTFDTLVPDTRECSLTIDGLDVEPVYALGPTGAANNTLAEGAINAPVVWLDDGALEAMKNKPVEGVIAVLRFGSPYMHQVLSQGVRAIIFVGNGRETQWQVRRQFAQMDAELPRVYVDKSTARRHGLMSADGARQARLSLRTVWKDVIGVNLWVEIPGESGATFSFDKEEAVVLSATFDTFGTVPARTPGMRRAANCALLAETAVELSKRPLKRSVFAVFFGSHYHMQDGARMFYYAMRRGRQGELDDRQEEYRAGIEKAESRIEALERQDFFAQEHPDLQDIAQSLDKRLAGQLSTLNFKLRQVRVELKQLQNKKLPTDAEEKRLEKLTAEEKALASKRSTLNELRRQIHERSITDPEGFGKLAAEERRDTRRQVRDFRKLLQHNSTHRNLYAAIGNKLLMGHYGFDFANSNDDWTLNMYGIGSQMFYHTIQGKWSQIEVGDFVRHVRALGDMQDRRGAGGDDSEEPQLFTEPVASLMLPERFCVPSVRSVASRVAHAMQIYGYQMMTVGDALNGDELPYRRPDVDLEGLVGPMADFCEGLAIDPALSQSCPLPRPSLHSGTVMHFRGEGGLRYLAYARGSTDIQGVPENGIVFCAPNKYLDMPAIAGQSYSAASRIRASGHIFMPVIYQNVPFRPLGFDSSSGMLQQFGTAGWSPRRLFYGHGGMINTPFMPGKYGSFSGTLAGSPGNSAFLTLYQQTTDDAFTFYTDKTGSFKAFEKEGLLVLGSTPDHPMGEGIPLENPPLYSRNALQQCAYDYLLLNEHRLEILRQRSILNDSLEGLHAEANQHWAQAEGAREDRNIPLAVAHEVLAAGMASRVAGPLRNVTNDMVRAVVLLLLLTIPFAFAMERLIFSATSIYRQVMGFTAFFLGAFVLLYLVHPAFSIASSPLIIFLAFVIILLSVVVITIVMSKFKKEIRAMQGLSTSAHGVASENSTALAAVLIGITGMRNRPMKTFLTALTIILLTFAIVVFASFTAVVGVTETYMGKGSGAQRIELRRFSGLPIPSLMLDTLKTLYGDAWAIYRRKAIFRSPGSEADDTLVVFQKEQRAWETMHAMMAIDAGELKYNEELAAALPGLAAWGDADAEAVGSAPPPLFLPERAAQSLKLHDGDTVTIGGKVFQFAGAFDPSDLDRMTFLDGARITPPDFETTQREMGEKASGGMQQDQMTQQETFIDPTRFTYYSARSLGVTVPGALAELERGEFVPGISAVMMYAGESADVAGTAREIAKVFVGPVTANGDEGVMQFFFSRSIQASGFSVVVVPLVLGGLIIFNSLLGSIVERRKEIFTYSAMGLAPPDVGALFFAESAVYAVLGGMGGYMFSQVAAKVVQLCGEWGLFVPPDMNFSSLSSVLTIFIVMAVVMISTIYPALKAGRSANPGVVRKWKMPTPAGDEIEFIFPFTVSAEDMGGILAFIAEHFENHGDSSLGNFAAADVEQFHSEHGLGIRANISLAPFDLGIMQKFVMFSRPSEVEGIDEIVVQMTRVSGTRAAWLRGNRVFVNDLREQFLLWRSLPFSTVEHYRELALDSESGGDNREAKG